MPRTTPIKELQKEGGAGAESPVRRSTRIAATTSTPNASTPTAKVTRRRGSASSEPEIKPSGRQSLARKDSEAAKLRVTRSVSKSPTGLKEEKLTPNVPRTRRVSRSGTDDETNQPSTSVADPPRRLTRRSSLSEISQPLNTIEESNSAPKPQKRVTRRRSSSEVPQLDKVSEEGEQAGKNMETIQEEKEADSSMSKMKTKSPESTVKKGPAIEKNDNNEQNVISAVDLIVEENTVEFADDKSSKKLADDVDEIKDEPISDNEAADAEVKNLNLKVSPDDGGKEKLNNSGSSDKENTNVNLSDQAVTELKDASNVSAPGSSTFAIKEIEKTPTKLTAVNTEKLDTSPSQKSFEDKNTPSKAKKSIILEKIISPTKSVSPSYDSDTTKQNDSLLENTGKDEGIKKKSVSSPKITRSVEKTNESLLLKEDTKKQVPNKETISSPKVSQKRSTPKEKEVVSPKEKDVREKDVIQIQDSNKETISSPKITNAPIASTFKGYDKIIPEKEVNEKPESNKTVSAPKLTDSPKTSAFKENDEVVAAKEIISIKEASKETISSPKQSNMPNTPKKATSLEGNDKVATVKEVTEETESNKIIGTPKITNSPKISTLKENDELIIAKEIIQIKEGNKETVSSPKLSSTPKASILKGTLKENDELIITNEIIQIKEGNKETTSPKITTTPKSSILKDTDKIATTKQIFQNETPIVKKTVVSVQLINSPKQSILKRNDVPTVKEVIGKETVSSPKVKLLKETSDKTISARASRCSGTEEKDEILDKLSEAIEIMSDSEQSVTEKEKMDVIEIIEDRNTDKKESENKNSNDENKETKSTIEEMLEEKHEIIDLISDEEFVDENLPESSGVQNKEKQEQNVSANKIEEGKKGSALENIARDIAATTVDTLNVLPNRNFDIDLRPQEGNVEENIAEMAKCEKSKDQDPTNLKVELVVVLEKVDANIKGGPKKDELLEQEKPNKSIGEKSDDVLKSIEKEKPEGNNSQEVLTSEGQHSDNTVNKSESEGLPEAIIEKQIEGTIPENNDTSDTSNTTFENTLDKMTSNLCELTATISDKTKVIPLKEETVLSETSKISKPVEDDEFLNSVINESELADINEFLKEIGGTKGRKSVGGQPKQAALPTTVEEEEEEPQEDDNSQEKRKSPEKPAEKEARNVEKDEDDLNKSDTALKQKISDLLNDKELFSDSDEDEEEEEESVKNPLSEFVDDEAEESNGEEEEVDHYENNEFHYEGESINSKDTDSDEDEEDSYEDDSFIDDHEDNNELLSDIEEFDSDDNKRKKTKITKRAMNSKGEKYSRIVSNKTSSSSDSDDHVFEEPFKTLPTIDISGNNSSSEDQIVEAQFNQNEVSKSGSRSRENSFRRSSINIHENVSIEDVENGNLSQRISKVVELFCNGIKGGNDGSGIVAFNVSLDYDGQADMLESEKRGKRKSTEPGENPTPTKILRTGEKEHVSEKNKSIEIIQNEEIIGEVMNESLQQSAKKKKSKKTDQNTSSVGDFDVVLLDNDDKKIVTPSKSSMKTPPSKKKNKKNIQETDQFDDVTDKAVKTGSPKKKSIEAKTDDIIIVTPSTSSIKTPQSKKKNKKLQRADRSDNSIEAKTVDTGSLKKLKKKSNEPESDDKVVTTPSTSSMKTQSKKKTKKLQEIDQFDVEDGSSKQENVMETTSNAKRETKQKQKKQKKVLVDDMTDDIPKVEDMEIESTDKKKKPKKQKQTKTETLTIKKQLKTTELATAIDKTEPKPSTSKSDKQPLKPNKLKEIQTRKRGLTENKQEEIDFEKAAKQRKINEKAVILKPSIQIQTLADWSIEQKSSTITPSLSEFPQQVQRKAQKKNGKGKAKTGKLIVPTANNNDNSWEMEEVTEPLAVSKKMKSKKSDAGTSKGLTFHPKDFKNQMLHCMGRVNRTDMKKVLRNKKIA